MADAPPPYNPNADEEVATSPLLANAQQPIVQPVVVQPIAQQPQQVMYTQQPQQVMYTQQPQQPIYQQPQQPMYQQQQQPQILYQQQGEQQQQQVAYVQPTYQQQQGQVVVSPAAQQIGGGQYQPSAQQLQEGIPQVQPIVITPKEPTIIGAPKDGVGMQEGCQRNPHCLTWILTLGLWYSLFSGVLCFIIDSNANDGYCGFFTNIGAFLGITGGIFVIYLIECFCSGTGKYLSNILQKEGASQFVERIKAQPAVIWWRVACYHWETRRRRKTVRDSNGNTRTEWETHREKVYTWRAREQYTYGTCIDVSGDLLGLDEWKLTKLKLLKTYGFLDNQSQQDYCMKLQTFRMLNWRDMHQEFHEEFTIPGFIDRILAESEPGIKPGWMSNGSYWICNLVGFSPCFRTAMAAKCGNVKYKFIKQISAARL